MILTSFDNGIVITITLEIPHDELIQAQFDEADRLLFKEAEKDNSSIAEQLVALEAVCRKIEQAKAKMGS